MILNKRNILITGASGFVGSFLIEGALRRGYNVWAGVRKTSNKLFLQDKRIRFIDLKYSRVEELKRQLIEFQNTYGNIDYVVHSAGLTKAVNKDDFDLVNHIYTKNLVDALRNSEHKIKKFVFISSLSAMGVGDEVNYSPFDISDVEAPNTHYGRSKLKAEQYIEQENKLPYIILRPTAIYGPRDRDFLSLVKSVKYGIAPAIGYRTQNPSFIYVEDLVNAAFLALENNVKNKKYLLSDGNTYTDKEYINILGTALCKKIVIRLRVPLYILKIVAWGGDLMAKLIGRPQTINTDKYKVLAQRNWNCTISPIVEDLGFKPQYNLQEGLAKTIKWYRDNQWL